VKRADSVHLRRPIDLVLADAGKRLLVANRDAGTLAVLDTQKLQLLSERSIGRRLAGLAAVPGGEWVAVADEAAGEVAFTSSTQRAHHARYAVKVGTTPVSVRVSADGRLATVACLWSRQIWILNLAAASRIAPGPPVATVAGIVDLPFAPRRQLLVPGLAQLIVADAFAGRLAVVDLRSRTLQSVRDLAAHNLRGLALDRGRKNLLLTHQMINSHGHTTSGDIRNGNLLTNNLRKLPLADVVNPWADVLRNDRLYPLGDVERGAGDPADVAECFDGQLLVTLAGTNELAIGRPERALWTRLPVGRRPTALAVDPAARRAYVANTFGDSISVVDLQAPRVLAEVSLGQSASVLSPEQRGEMLFYDARLSFDAWFSCHSCHPDGHSNGRLNDNFTDGSFGTPKRVLSLLGVKDTPPWAWNGGQADLKNQVRTSLRSTMQGPPPTAEQVNDLTAFLHTLAPPPAVARARGRIDAEALTRGRRTFAREKCAACHTPPTYTSPQTYDVGLRDEAGGTRFNPPSLRGVSQAGPYFHDNRALILDEVFSRYHHGLPGKLSDQDLLDLLHFLKSL
jgi:DNA-binding beta-propeller fold protein YncE